MHARYRPLRDKAGLEGILWFTVYGSTVQGDLKHSSLLDTPSGFRPSWPDYTKEQLGKIISSTFHLQKGRGYSPLTLRRSQTSPLIAPSIEWPVKIQASSLSPSKTNNYMLVVMLGHMGVYIATYNLQGCAGKPNRKRSLSNAKWHWYYIAFLSCSCIHKNAVCH